MLSIDLPGGSLVRESLCIYLINFCPMLSFDWKLDGARVS